MGLGNRALSGRLLLVSISLIGGLALYWQGRGYVEAPQLYPGDRHEVLDCEACGGRGSGGHYSEESPLPNGRCPACGGDGKISRVIPGPQHPTRVVATVVSRAACGEDFLDEHRDNPPAGLLRVGLADVFPGNEGPVVPGAIAGAKLLFANRETGERIEASTTQGGRLLRRLPPGNWRVEATAPGLVKAEAEIEIEPLTEPIELDGAGGSGPAAFYTGAQPHYLYLLIALPPEGKKVPRRRGAEVRVYRGAAYAQRY